MNDIAIKHIVKYEFEGSYYTIEFDVPDNVKKFSISYSYAKIDCDGNKNIVDFGIENSHGELIGWSGSDRQSVFVGEEQSSAGFLRTKIESGKWRIIVGAYKIAKAGVDVEYNISFEKKRAMWYVGDLHTHSTASDGEFDIAKLGALAKKKRLDFLAVSNHNNYSENINLPSMDEITLIHAVEWTHYMGHINFFGLEKPFEKSFVANSEKERDAIVDYAKKNGAIVSVNHPKCSFCPYKWTLEERFEFVEIWNGIMRKDEISAINWWKEQIFSGKRLVALGGSDYHRRKSFVKLGNPVVFVLAQSRSESDLLCGIRRGNCYITKNSKSINLEVDACGKTFGDEISLNGKPQIVKISAKKLKGSQQLIATFNGEIIARFDRKQAKKLNAIEIKNSGALIVEVVGKSLLCKGNAVQAIANPIYFVD